MVFGTSLYDLPRLRCLLLLLNWQFLHVYKPKAKKAEAKEAPKKWKTEAKHSLVLSSCLFISFCFGFLYHKLYTSGSFCFFGCCCCCRLRVRSLSARCAHILLIVLFMMLLLQELLLLLLPFLLLLLSGTASSSPSQTQLLSQSRHIVVITAICKWQRFLSPSHPLSPALPLHASHPTAAAFKIKLIICAFSSSLFVRSVWSSHYDYCYGN